MPMVPLLCGIARLLAADLGTVRDELVATRTVPVIINKTLGSGPRFPSFGRIYPMRTSIPSRGVPLVRVSAAVVLILTELALFGFFARGGAAQEQAKPGAPQGQGGPGKGKQTGKPKEEEEEHTKPARK